MNSNPQCKICQRDTFGFGEATVLGKYLVQYFRCNSCGFIQTESPYWLDEAYSSTITNLDIGLVRRNLRLATQVSIVADLFYGTKGEFIDYGGGYGLFVRLMRDQGLNFYWYDPYCQNLFAQYFEAELAPTERYTLLTAFEVFEHLVDPCETIVQMAQLADSIMFTTLLVPTPTPELGAWWYYGHEHGQHISLFSLASLEALGQRLGLHLYTNGTNLHLLSSKVLNPRLFRFAISGRVPKLWSLLRRHHTLIDADYDMVLKRIRSEV